MKKTDDLGVGGAAVLGERLPEVAALVVGVAPVLDPALTAGDGVVEARDVADRIDVIDRRAEVVVDDDAVVELEARSFEEPGLRLDADADDGEEGFDLLARGGHGAGQRAAVRPELLDLLAEQQLDAVLAVEVGDLVRELLRGERRHEVVALLDERDLEPAHAQRGRDLGADEAAADDEDLARLGRLPAASAAASASVRKVWTAGRSPPGTESVRGCAPLAITSVPYGIDSPPASWTRVGSGSIDSTVVSRRSSTTRSSYSSASWTSAASGSISPRRMPFESGGRL